MENVYKNIKMEYQKELMVKTSQRKKVKYLGFTIINMNCILFQNNYINVWNEIMKEFLRWENTIMKNLCSESESISQNVVFILKNTF